MQNITRTFNRYKIEAYDLSDNEGEVVVEKIAECEILNAGMTKTEARACLRRETGVDIKKGAVVKWQVVGYEKYAMSLDQFLDCAVMVEKR